MTVMCMADLKAMAIVPKVDVVPVVVRCQNPVGGGEWKITLNPDGTVTKPDAMTDAEALFLTMCIVSGFDWTKMDPASCGHSVAEKYIGARQ